MFIILFFNLVVFAANDTSTAASSTDGPRTAPSVHDMDTHPLFEYTECCVCFGDFLQHIHFGCGHFTCEDCANNLAKTCEDPPPCPMCRKPIMQTEKQSWPRHVALGGNEACREIIQDYRDMRQIKRLSEIPDADGSVLKRAGSHARETGDMEIIRMFNPTIHDYVIHNDMQAIRETLEAHDESQPMCHAFGGDGGCNHYMCTLERMLKIAIDAENCRPTLVKHLLTRLKNSKYKKPLSDYASLLHDAYPKRPHAVEVLLDFNVSPNAIDRESPAQKTILGRAAELNDARMCESLINFQADVNQRDIMGRSALAYTSNPYVINQLLDAGAEVEEVDLIYRPTEYKSELLQLLVSSHSASQQEAKRKLEERINAAQEELEKRMKEAKEKYQRELRELWKGKRKP